MPVSRKHRMRPSHRSDWHPVMNLCIRLLIPYLAVLVFWYGFSNAWLTIAAYHLQILVFARGRIVLPTRPPDLTHLLWALPAFAAGPLLYALLPHLGGEPLTAWLAEHRVSPGSLLVLLPYFAFVHPWLEQVHWHPLREQTALAHPMFAGYHILVVASLMTWPWLVLVFCLLMLTSYLWTVLSRHAGSLTPAYASHAIADFGIVVAAWMAT